MPRICEALNRPIREPHPDVANAMAAKVELLLSGVAVDTHATVAVENEDSQLYDTSPWVADRRAAEIIRPAPVQTDETGPDQKSCAETWRLLNYNREFCRLLKAVQAAKLHAELSPEQQAIKLSAGGPGTGTSWTAMHKSQIECAVEDGHGAAAWSDAGCWPALRMCSEAGQKMDTCANSLWRYIFFTRFAASTEEPEPDHTGQSNARYVDSLSRRRDMRISNDMSRSFMIGMLTKKDRHR